MYTKAAQRKSDTSSPASLPSRTVEVDSRVDDLSFPAIFAYFPTMLAGAGQGIRCRQARSLRPPATGTIDHQLKRHYHDPPRTLARVVRRRKA